MPTCRECQGSGQIEVKTEITSRCPDCDGTKLLPDGTDCKRCNKWGEVGTGEYNVEKQLCKTCWGSGKVTEGSLTIWYLIRVVPATLILVGGGGALIMAAWLYLGLPWLTTLLTVVIFGGWGGLMYYFTSQMPGLGEISPTNWFLSRVIPTTVVAIAVGGTIIWSAWVYSQNLPFTVIVVLGVLAIWGVLMYYFISNMPE